jgi:hypothetical protein
LNFLAKDGTLKAFYVAAILTLDEEFRKDYNWKSVLQDLV